MRHLRVNGEDPIQNSEANLGDFACKETYTSAIGGSSSALAGTCSCWYSGYPTLTDIFTMSSSKNCNNTGTGDLLDG